MSLIIEQDLKEVLGQINQNLEIIKKDITELKIGQAEIKGDIKALDEKVKGVDERLKSVEFINRSIVVGLVLALAAGAIKLFFPGYSVTS